LKPSALSQNPEQRLAASELQDIIKVIVHFVICFNSNCSLLKIMNMSPEQPILLMAVD